MKMKSIRHIIEPSRLLLVWQPPEGQQRRRRVVGELNRGDTDQVTLRYLVDSEDYKAATEHGFGGYPAFKLLQPVHYDGVLEILMRRLPPRSRADFDQYLEKLAVRPGTNLSDFALLGYSEAKLPGDGFSIINPFTGVDGPCEFLSEIAGYRYYSGMEAGFLETVKGASVNFKPEPENQFDPNAVQIYVSDRLIGYVNRVQAPSFLHWLRLKSVKAEIERVNGIQERPQVSLFVTVDQTGDNP